MSVYAQVATIRHILEDTDLVPNRRVALDVGAYIGQWTEVMLGHFDRVIAFEPCHESFAHLMDRCGGNPKLETYRCAVLDQHGLVTLVTPISKKIYSQFAVPSSQGTGRSIKIDTLDLQVCDLLKVDVEGAELLALRGAERTIQRCRPVIIVENLRNLCLKHYAIPVDAVNNYLRSLGYKRAFKKRPDVLWQPK